MNISISNTQKMISKKLVLTSLIVSSLTLSACVAPPMIRNEQTFDKITQTMQDAKATNDKIIQQRRMQGKSLAERNNTNSALLPPLSQQNLPKRGEHRFNLSVNEAPAGSVFLGIVSGTKYSMLLPNDLEGTISVNLKQVTVFEALEAIRDLYGYEFKVKGNRITVIPNTLQTRVFQVSYLAAKRGGASSTQVTSSTLLNSYGGGGSGTGNSYSPYASSYNSSSSGSSNNNNLSTALQTSAMHDFWTDLSTAIATVLDCHYQASGTQVPTAAAPGMGGGLLGGMAGMMGLSSSQNNLVNGGNYASQSFNRPQCKDGRHFVINSQSGVVMVKAMPSELREVHNLLKVLQANIERQVMIESKIIEVSLGDGFRTGINWGAYNKRGDLRWGMNTTSMQRNPEGGVNSITDLVGEIANNSLAISFATGDFTAIIRFLQEQGKVYVMSSPRITTLNNQKAVLKVGTDRYYVTRITPSYTVSNTGGGTTTNPPSVDVNPFFSGIALDVTPQISENDLITMHIRPMITDVTEENKRLYLGTEQGEYTLPLAVSDIRETDSIVKVRNGMIVAIGGLMKEAQDDSVSKIPLVGDIPLVGHFFRHSTRMMEKRELVILIKPTIINDDSDWNLGQEDTLQRLKETDPREIKSPFAPTVQQEGLL